MDDFKNFNKALEFIDNHLDSEITERDIYQLTSYSYNVFSRIFSVLSGIPLGEYIRSRKLSAAAIELQEEHTKVVDVAMKYGYQSSDAFSYAFKSFHGCSPSEVKKGEGFHIVQPLRFSLTVRGGQFKTKIEVKEGFRLVGICADVRPEQMSVEIWKELSNQLVMKCPRDWAENNQLYGLFFHGESEGTIHYMIGFRISDSIEEVDIQKLGLDRIDIPEEKYAVVNLGGELPNNIHQAWSYLLGIFLPQEGYRHAGSYDFELYSGYEVNSPDFSIELWVPIVKQV
ncbi:AraC family transcriptional regulator [Streptococcus sobrinus]|uniref:AraC family transcriptional regulator n=1 Tax=Streptococcus sobrinus TaxID=1310 RepID=UPI0002F6646E|nr:AraC family transcriptional regulator [Streptococcus sobrinus]